MAGANVGSIRITAEADASDFETQLVREVTSAMSEVVREVVAGMRDVNTALGRVDAAGVEQVGDAARQASAQLGGVADAAQQAARAAGQIDASNVESTGEAARQASTQLSGVAEAAQQAAQAAARIDAGNIQDVGQAGQTAAAGVGGISQSADDARAALNRIDASALQDIISGSDRASEALRQLDAQQLNSLITEANRAGQNLGQEIRAGASDAERAINGLDQAGLDRLVQDARQAQQELEQVGDSAGGVGDAISGAFGDAVGGIDVMGFSLDDIMGKFGKFGPVAAAAAAAIGAAFAAVSAELDRIEIGARFQAEFGVAGAEAEKASEIAKSAFRGGFGESMEEVLGTVGALHNSIANLGTTAPGDVEKLTIAAENLKDIFGVETQDSIQLVEQLIRNGLAKNATEGFDLVTAAFQKMPAAMRDELPDIINEYGTFFHSIGFDGQEAFDLIVSASHDGQIAMDKAGDAIKEFGIRATDLGDTGAQEALASIGLSGAEMANDLLAGGDTAKAAFDKIVNGLVGIENPGKQAAASVALFGPPLEDLDKAKIPGFLQGLKDAGKGMEGFAGASEKLGETLDTPSAKIEALWRTIKGGFMDGLAAAGAGLITFGEAIWEHAVKPLVEALQPVFETIGRVTRELWEERLKPFFEELQPKIEKLAPLFEFLAGTVEVAWNLIAGIISISWEIVGPILGFFLDTILLVIDALGSFVTFLSELPAKIGEIATAVGDWFASLPEKLGEFAVAVGNWFSQQWAAFVSGLGAIIDTAAGFFTGLPGRIVSWIGDLAAGLGGWFSSQWELFKAGLGIIIDTAAAFFSSLPGKIVTWLGNLAAAVGGWFSSQWEGFKSGLSGVIDSAAGFFTTFPGKAVSWLGNLAGQISAWFAGQWEAFKSGLAGTIDSVAGFFTGLPGKIAGWLGDAGSWLVDVGRQVVTGLANGIKGAASVVLNAILDLIPDAIEGPIRDALGIKSPSKVFMGIGENLMEGLAKGIKEAAPMVAEEMEAVASDVASTEFATQPPVVAAAPVEAGGFAAPAPAAGEGGGEAAAAAPADAGTTEAFTEAMTAAAAAANEQFLPAVTAMAATQTEVFDPAIQASSANIALLGEQTVATANEHMIPALTTLAATTQAVANEQMVPAINNVGATTQNLAAVFGASVNEQMVPAWQNTGTVLQGTADGVINPALNNVGITTQNLAASFDASVNGQMSPAWQSMAANLEAVRSGQIDPVMSATQNAVAQTATAFGTQVDQISNHWQRLKEGTAEPVRWTIDKPFNAGVVGSWNAVAEQIGLDKINPVPINFAGGGFVGRVRGPGGPTSDSVPGMVEYGSFIMRAAAAKRAGLDNLDMFARAMSGKPGGGGGRMVPVNLSAGEVALPPQVVASIGLRNLQYFNDHPQDPQGMFPNMRKVGQQLSGGGLAQGSPAWEQLKRGYEWARSRDGRPYVLGGSANGGDGTDCSGYMSGIANVIQGGDGTRQWATMAFNNGGNEQMPSGPQGFVAGLAAGFSIGVHNGGAAGGHTAGTIGGVEGLPAVNVESGGSHGDVAFGARGAVGADHSQFETKYHLPLGPDGKFVSGGEAGSVNMGAIVMEKIGPIWEKINAELDARKTIPGRMNTLPPPTSAKLQQAVTDTLMEKASAIFVASGGVAGDVESYRPVVVALLKAYGHPEAWVSNTLRRMNQESSGNPQAVNGYDVNAQNGTPSVGLMQVIGPTYASYKDPQFDKGPYMHGVSIDPAGNISASMRYCMATYGSLPAGYDRPGGYARGGLVGSPFVKAGVFDTGGHLAAGGLAVNTGSGPERVLTERQTESFDKLVAWLTGGRLEIDWSGVEALLQEGIDQYQAHQQKDEKVQAEQSKALKDVAKQAAPAGGAGAAGVAKAAGEALTPSDLKSILDTSELFAGRADVLSKEEVRAKQQEEFQKFLEQIRQWLEGENSKHPSSQPPPTSGEGGRPRTFDMGGVITGPAVFATDTASPERVLSPEQTSAFEALVAFITGPKIRAHLGGEGRGGRTENRTVNTRDLVFNVNEARDGKRVAAQARDNLLSLLDR